MARLLRHRQTKGAETDRPILPPPRHIPTLPKAEVQRGLRNVRCWGKSRPQFRAAEGLLLAVVSIDRRNTLIFDVTKKECWNELQTSDLFYE